MTFSCHHNLAVSWYSNTSVAYAYCFNGLGKPQKYKLNIPYPLSVAVRKAGERAGIAYCDRSGVIHHISINLSSSSGVEIQEKVLACISDDVLELGYCTDGIAVLGSYGVHYIYPQGNSVGVQKIVSWDEPKDCHLLSYDDFIAIEERKDDRTKAVSVYKLRGRGRKELVKLEEVTTTGKICLHGKYLAEIDGMHIRIFAEGERVERKWVATATAHEKIWWTNGKQVIISAMAGAHCFFLVLPVEDGKGGWGRAVGPYLEAATVDAGKYLYCLAPDYGWGWNLESRDGELIISSKPAASYMSWVKNENEIICRGEQGELAFIENTLAKIVLANSNCETASIAMLYLDSH